MPARRTQTFVVSVLMHLSAAGLIVDLAGRPHHTVMRPTPTVVSVRLELPPIVFTARPTAVESHGGGGGGNRQSQPIRHAEGVGPDAITLPTAVPIPTAGFTDSAAVPPLLLDARPLAAGTSIEIGLPVGGVSYGTSTGAGSGGGVGEGIGTGIGPGRGPGYGPGSGGGIGGGVYRPGGSVTPPRVLMQTRPSYTSDALSARVQGTVVLELVVGADGHPVHIRVVRSLDPGLDEQAIIAAREWRFEPGRLAGRPVDVQVIVMMDFTIR